METMDITPEQAQLIDGSPIRAMRLQARASIIWKILSNFIVAILSGAAGGGGGLIITPLMVLLGLTPAEAVGTGKFGGFGISLGASSRFFREKIGYQGLA